MRLAHPEMKSVLRLNENQVTLLAIEKADLFRRLVRTLRHQSYGQPGDFVLSRDWTPLPIEKTLVLTSDAFSLNLNERRQVTALQKQTSQLAYSEHMFEKTAQLFSNLENWMEALLLESPYAVHYDTEIQIESFLKQLNFRFAGDEGDLPESLERFIKVHSAFSGTKVFVFVNLRSLLSLEELQDFYKSSFYEKARVVMLETNLPENRLDCEDWHLIDNDLCELYSEDDS